MNEREYPTRPYCAVGVVMVDRGRVLLTQRGTPPSVGTWSIPGGGLELGETLEEGARREIREELGLSVELRGVVDAVDVIRRDQDGRIHYHYVIVDFLGSRPEGELRLSEEVREARWVTPEELGSFQLPPRTLQVIRKALAQAGRDEHRG